MEYPLEIRSLNGQGFQEENPFLGGSDGLPSPSPYRYRKEPKNKSFRKTILVLRFFACIIATAIAGVTTYQEYIALSTFITTRNDTITLTDPNDPNSSSDEQRNPWPRNPVLWPAILMLSVSGATFLFGLLNVFFYCIGKKLSKAVTAMHSKLMHVFDALHILMWAAVSILYRLGKTTKDLWGWACTAAGNSTFPEEPVHFNELCTKQTQIWELSLASTGLQILTFVIACLVLCVTNT